MSKQTKKENNDAEKMREILSAIGISEDEIAKDVNLSLSSDVPPAETCGSYRSPFRFDEGDSFVQSPSALHCDCVHCRSTPSSTMSPSPDCLHKREFVPLPLPADPNSIFSISREEFLNLLNEEGTSDSEDYFAVSNPQNYSLLYGEFGLPGDEDRDFLVANDDDEEDRKMPAPQTLSPRSKDDLTNLFSSTNDPNYDPNIDADGQYLDDGTISTIPYDEFYDTDEPDDDDDALVKELKMPSHLHDKRHPTHHRCTSQLEEAEQRLIDLLESSTKNELEIEEEIRVRGKDWDDIDDEIISNKEEGGNPHLKCQIGSNK